MYSYQQAADAVDKELARTDGQTVSTTAALDLASSLADTIGQWESLDNTSAKTMEVMRKSIGDLKLERDTLIDEKTDLAGELARVSHTIGVLEGVLDISK